MRVVSAHPFQQYALGSAAYVHTQIDFAVVVRVVVMIQSHFPIGKLFAFRCYVINRENEEPKK